MRQIGRPPSESTMAPDGSLTAVWIVEGANGERRHTYIFDDNKELVKQEVITVPR